MRRIPAVRAPWLLSAVTALPLMLSAPSLRAESEAPEPDATQPVGGTLAKAEPQADPKADEAAPALAQADVEGEAAPAAEAAPAETVSEAAPEKKEEKKADSTQGNAALAAGGVVVSDKGFPLGANVSWTNSYGTGWLLPGYRQQPNWTSDIWFAPNFAMPKLVDWQPTTVISGGIGVTIDLISAYRSRPLAGPVEGLPRLSDASVRVLFPGLFKEDFTGIVFTPNFATVLPTSLFSRHQNRFLGLNAGLQASWNKGLGDIWSDIGFLGTIGAQWRAGATGWAFSNTSPTLPCDERMPPSLFGGLVDPGNPGANFPLIAPRDEEYIADDPGMCRIAGRQWLASVGNSGNAFWNFSDPTGGGHTFLVSLGVSNIFLRPLTDRPDLRSPWAASQSFFNSTDYTNGSVQYNYQLPVWSHIQVTAGVSSFQNMYDDQGNVRFPWFDFALGNQFTQGFVSVNYNL